MHVALFGLALQFYGACRHNRMLCAVNSCQNATLHGSTKIKLPFLLFDEPNLYNDNILRNSKYIVWFCINFPWHCVLNQVHLDTNLLDNVILTKVFLQPTKKPRSVGPHKWKSRIKIKKVKSVSTQQHGESTDPNSDKKKYYNSVCSTQTII